MTGPVILAAQRAPLGALVQIGAVFPGLPAACFGIDDVFPDRLDISVHDDLGHFEVWRTALGLPVDAVEYSTASTCMMLVAYGAYSGATVKLVGFAPLMPERPPLQQVLEELRAAQPGVELAEQRHQFLDLDPDLVREDYARPAPVPQGGMGEVA